MSSPATEEPTGVSISHTSVPSSRWLAPDRSGTAHLVVVEKPEPTPPDLLPLTSGSACEVISAAAPEARQLLDRHLAQGRVGLRLYLIGDEAFTRQLESVALGAGLLPAEIHTRVLDGRVRVWCTHCKAITEAASCNLVECSGCARQLLVYHHYSRRHAAYMGFQADAELAGELPERRSGLPWR